MKGSSLLVESLMNNNSHAIGGSYSQNSLPSLPAQNISSTVPSDPSLSTMVKSLHPTTDSASVGQRYRSGTSDRWNKVRLSETDGILIVQYRLPIRMYRKRQTGDRTIGFSPPASDSIPKPSDSSYFSRSPYTSPLQGPLPYPDVTFSESHMSPGNYPFDRDVIEDDDWIVYWDEEALLAPKGPMAGSPLANTRVTWIGTLPVHVTEDEEEQVTRLLEHFRCVPVFLPLAMHYNFYEGFCRDTLWPVFHNVMDVYGKIPTRWWRRERQSGRWQAYKDANNRFATTVVEAWHEGDLVWVHDYHLLLVPSLVARRRVSPVALFLHVPFPSSEIFRSLSVRDELLRAMLFTDHIGFHLFEYARHFVTSCRRILGVTYSPRKKGCLSLEWCGRDVTVTVTHIGIEPQYILNTFNFAKTYRDLEYLDRNFDKLKSASTPAVEVLKAEEDRLLLDETSPEDTTVLAVEGSSHVPKRRRSEEYEQSMLQTLYPSTPQNPHLLPTVVLAGQWKLRFPGRKIIVGMDASDRLKGVPMKLSAFDEFLTKKPHWKGKVVLIQICYSASGRVEGEDTATEEIARQAEEINRRHRDPKDRKSVV